MSKTQQNSKVIDFKANIQETLDWVGIESMTLPIQYRSQGHLYRTAAVINLAVSLGADYKGIDMAKLFFNAQEILANQEIDFAELQKLSESLHCKRSLNTSIEISFDIFTKQNALRSKEEAWRSYPISMELVNIDGFFEAYLNFEILYASTCPCSEAASRTENLPKFQEFLKKSKNPKKDFEKWYLDSGNSFAHPHAQKSKAKFSLQLQDVPQYPVDFILEMVAELEDLIQTAVHAGVRQEDEAAFTTRMGENLIFIEDAARKFKEYIKNQDAIQSSTVELVHNESIHPHNAKAFFIT